MVRALADHLTGLFTISAHRKRQSNHKLVEVSLEQMLIEEVCYIQKTLQRIDVETD